MAKYTYIPNRVIDTNGISDGALIHVYLTGTTTPATIYSDAAMTVPMANPCIVPAGAAVPEIFYAGSAGSIRVKVVSDSGVTVSDDDPYDPSGIAAEVYLRDQPGVDPTGQADSSAAFIAALASGAKIIGSPGDTYLIGSEVSVPAGKEIIGNGATLKIGPGVIGFRFPVGEGNCKISGWNILGNGGLYAVLNQSDNNSFTDNVCRGNIGHFFFSSNAKHVLASGNVVEGMSADDEITTAIVCETCQHIIITDNRFENIPVGWGVQIRDSSEDFTVANNSFLQTMWTDTETATGGQTVFNFTLGSVCLLKRVQVNGLPVSSGVAITGSGPSYTVTFDAGLAGGEEVKLVGYRGAENIQINTGSSKGSINANSINGTGDSGIVAHGSALAINANSIRNCGFAGIAVYGDQDEVSITGNQIADCAQLDDGGSSPDDPMVASVFAGAILLGGENATVIGNVIDNSSGTMRYGIRINKSDMALRTDGTATISLRGNCFKGDFVDGKIFAPNEATGQRVNSIDVDGPLVRYPQQIDIDQAWDLVPFDATDGTAYFGIDGFNLYAVRDTSIKLGGVATIKTQPNSYIDFDLLAAGAFRNCNVTISFWAKNDSGSSYVSVFTELGGLFAPLTATITDTNWRQYTISFPLTDNLEDAILLRIGGTTGFANIQHIEISGRRM